MILFRNERLTTVFFSKRANSMSDEAESVIDLDRESLYHSPSSESLRSSISIQSLSVPYRISEPVSLLEPPERPVSDSAIPNMNVATTERRLSLAADQNHQANSSTNSSSSSASISPSTSSKREENFFCVARHVPIVGIVYSTARGYYKQKHGKIDEAKQSWHRDLANINPIRSLTNIVRDTVSVLNNRDEGIWIGKKGLKNRSYGITISPGHDFYHWAVMIRGTVYQVRRHPENKDGILPVVSNHENIKKSYHWYLYKKDDQDVVRSDQELYDFAMAFEKLAFASFATLENTLGMGNKEQEKSNCQNFIQRMVAYATKTERLKVKAELYLVTGTILF